MLCRQNRDELPLESHCTELRLSLLDDVMYPALVAIISRRWRGRCHLSDPRLRHNLLAAPLAAVEHQHADLGHVDRAHPQSPAAGYSAGFIDAVPAVVSHAKRLEQILLGEFIFA